MQRVLVTDGAGFFTSQLCKRLLSSGAEVICLDDENSSRRENVTAFADDESFTFLEQDVRLPDPLPPVDRIYHLASRASPDDFTDFPVDIALSDTQGTRRLLDHARMAYASTSEVYGDGEQTILELTDTASSVVHESLPEDDPARRRPDITRARPDPGWDPKTPLSRGLGETVEYFKRVLSTSNPNDRS